RRRSWAKQIERRQRLQNCSRCNRENHQRRRLRNGGVMLYVYFKAPFGAFRSFRSVEMSPTAEFITHSAAYGLLLGLAGVDRQHKDRFADANIAIGIKRLPKVGRTYQQLIQGKRVLD